MAVLGLGNELQYLDLLTTPGIVGLSTSTRQRHLFPNLWTQQEGAATCVDKIWVDQLTTAGIVVDTYRSIYMCAELC